MNVYHLVAAENVGDDGLIMDARLVRHGVIEAGRVGALAGPIDPLTHLNLDFAAHQLGECVVVAALAVGAAVGFAGDGFAVARPQRAAFARLGAVDVGARRAQWLAQAAPGRE